MVRFSKYVIILFYRTNLATKLVLVAKLCLCNNGGGGFFFFWWWDGEVDLIIVRGSRWVTLCIYLLLLKCTTIQLLF